jgi:hypothetical protein
MPYKKMRVVDADEVPDWQRREPKWDELTRDVLNLEPGKSLPVLFDTFQEAKRASNAVRENVNLIAKAVIVRTRLVRKDDGGAELFFIRTHPTAIKE